MKLNQMWFIVLELERPGFKSRPHNSQLFIHASRLFRADFVPGTVVVTESTGAKRQARVQPHGGSFVGEWGWVNSRGNR